MDLIAAALRLPDVFDFDVLFRIDAITAAKGTELFALLQIYLNDGLSRNVVEEVRESIYYQHEFGSMLIDRNSYIRYLMAAGFSEATTVWRRAVRWPLVSGASRGKSERK